MRSFGFVHVLLILVLLLAYQCVQAQDYVVTYKADTIRGKVKLFNFGPDKKVQITPEGKKKILFEITKVKSIHLEGEVFHPQKGPYGYTFMRLIKPGFLSLYAYQLENQSTYDGFYLVRKDGESTDVPNLTFKRVIKKFLENCPEIVKKIDEGDYSRKDLHEIIDQYNACIDAHTVDHAGIVAKNAALEKKAEPWSELEQKLRSHADFPSKADAIEMIGEIRSKISRSEKIPNFMIDGLKNSLKESSLSKELDAALQQLN